VESVVDSPSSALGRAIALLEERFHPIAIVLFGSRASGRQRDESDFDLAILAGGSHVDALAVASARTDLEDVLRKSADLVVLDDASPILAMEVLRNHRTLRLRDEEAFERFVVRTLGAYFDLKRVREPIERALLSGRDS
jgi:uncharacterized protein